MDVLPHVHGAKRLWASRPLGEMSIHGAKRPWGELSVGREVLTLQLQSHTKMELTPK